MRKGHSQKGTTLIDLLISMAIIALLFGGIYAVFFSILGAASNIDARTAAIELINQQVEMVRGMSYDNIGTVGGAPAGIIPQQQTLSVGGYSFLLTTNVRNIDDPFDGITGGAPNDTAPADYKLVQFDAVCRFCQQAISYSFTTTIAPKNLESASNNGSLFVNVFDANLAGVPAAAVHVVNNAVAPSIDLTDTTNASGVLQLVGVPTSTQSYQVTVTKSGFSSDQTYTASPSNPNPSKPPATVAVQTVTPISFQIDRVSQLNVFSSNDVCVAIPNIPFSFLGNRLIGTVPDVLKFSTTSVTSATGSRPFSSIEWDSYSLAITTSSYNLDGTIPLSPIKIDPSSTVALRFVLKSVVNPALLVSAVDAASGAGIQEAAVTITKGAFSQTLTTGHSAWKDTDWSGVNYVSQSGNIETELVPGQISLMANASGTYATGTTSWIISKTIDFGGASATMYAIDWNPASQPGATGPQSIQLQLAANNDSATWNFVGPDGTSGTYFSASGTTPSALNGNRYLRYKTFLQTADENTTPTLADITFDFNSVCVPPAQVLFTGLSQGTYDVDVTATNYFETSSTASVGSGYQTSTVLLTHQ